jgi:hypothetical protein
MRLIVLAILAISLAGCYTRPDYATTQPDYDEVWSSYHFRGPLPRAYIRDAFGRWVSTGRDVTQADIDAAPCKVIVGHYPTSYYAFDENTIYLDAFAKISVLKHESQHCIDRHNGISDHRELERRGMIAEMDGSP